MTQLRDLVRRAPKRGLQFPSWLERVVSVGIVATDPQIVRRQRCVNTGAFASGGSAMSHLLFNSIHDFYGLAVVNGFNMIFICAIFVIPQLHRFGRNVGAITLILLALIVHSCVVWSFGLESDLQVYFVLGGVVLFFFGVQNWRLSFFFFGLFVVSLLIALNFAPAEGLVMPEDRAFRDVLSNQAMINVSAIFAALLFFALAALQRAEVELQDQHERSEALIGTVMPHSIAARLKSGHEERIADRIETLSVLFADLVGFTGAVRDLAPEEVVEFLDGLVSSFDALAETHDVEKIKTIGARHPPLGERKLRMRIGIHCGPATAGIIGATRFSYDVWGDAVNFASRMESHGVPDRIQVSEAFSELTKDAFDFEERGTTDLKGLGAARTFFLAGERSAGQVLVAGRPAGECSGSRS